MFDFLASDKGRSAFWAERSQESGDVITFNFVDGSEFICPILEKDPPARLRIEYAGADTLFELIDDGNGGCDLTLHANGVPDHEWDEVHAGWVSVLLIMKAAVDHGVDLRSHDPLRAWPDRYVDQ